MTTTGSVQRKRESRIARLEAWYRNELVYEGERLELREQIIRLKRKAGAR